MTSLHAGSIIIHDIERPTPNQIDRQWMWRQLCNIRRFNSHPDALTVAEHLRMCLAIAAMTREPWPVVQWAWRHDCHEAYLGDISRPVKEAINSPRLVAMEAAWDNAICRAEGVEPPDIATRSAVHRIDMMACRIEMDAIGMMPDDCLPHPPAWMDVGAVFRMALLTP